MAKKVVATGHRALDRKLATLPLKIQKAVTRSSLRKAGKLIQGKAKQNLTANQSIESGELRKGVRVRASKRSRTRVGIFVSTTERREGTGRWPFGGAQVEFGRKGAKAKPFLRPAGYGSEKEIRAYFISDVQRQLNLLKGGFTLKGLQIANRIAGRR